MKKISLFLSLVGLSVSVASATTITENFSSNPLQKGWQIFGDTNLFQWDSINHQLAVTWDSARTNSYFYHPLGTILSRSDDFSIAFDLFLNDVMTGNEPNKTAPFPIGIGFMNLPDSTQPGFLRGTGFNSPNLMEFDYFPAGYYSTFGPADPTITPTFISSNSFGYAPTQFTPYLIELPTNKVVHVAMNYTATNQTLTALLTTNGITFAQLLNVTLNDPGNSSFGGSDDFRVNAFSISSYSGFGQDPDYAGSVLAHGIVNNIVVTVPPPPVQNLRGFFTGNQWQVEFLSRTNWSYVLEGTQNFQSWTTVSDKLNGTGGQLILQNTNSSLSNTEFYRVNAQRN